MRGELAQLPPSCVFALGFLDCLGAPWEPVDRIVGVLEEVGARFVGEAVRHGRDERNVWAGNDELKNTGQGPSAERLGATG